MKYCIHCGKEIKTGANFCPACGKSQTQEQAEPNPVETVIEKSVQIQQNLNEQLKNNQTVQQLTKESKNYFSWLNSQIKRGNNEKTQKIPIFGVVNFLLLIVLNSIAITRSIIIISYYSNETPLSLFIESMLLMGSYFFIFVLVFFLIATRLQHKTIVFSEAFDALFSPASLTVYISLASVVLSFLFKDSFMIIAGLFCLIALLVSLSFTDTMWKREDVVGRFCLTLLTLFISFIVIFFLFKILGGSKLIDIFVYTLFR